MDKTEVIRLIKEWIKADTEINEMKEIERNTPDRNYPSS
jgi:hypothetical protein